MSLVERNVWIMSREFIECNIKVVIFIIEKMKKGKNDL